MQKPKAFPRERPVGCARRPVVPEPRAGASADATTATWDDLNHTMTEDGLQELWNVIFTCGEHELCGLHDLVGSDGDPLGSDLGRARGMRLVRRPITPPRITGQHGKVDRIGHALCWATARLQEMVHLAARAAASRDLPAAALRQWRGLHNAFRTTRGLLAELVCHDATWGPTFQRIGAFTLGQDAGPLREVLGDVIEASRNRKKSETQRRAAAWREWIALQIKRGGGALHRYVKRTTETPDRPVLTLDGPCVAPQDMVESDLSRTG